MARSKEVKARSRGVGGLQVGLAGEEVHPPGSLAVVGSDSWGVDGYQEAHRQGSQGSQEGGLQVEGVHQGNRREVRWGNQEGVVLRAGEGIPGGAPLLRAEEGSLPGLEEGDTWTGRRLLGAQGNSKGADWIESTAVTGGRVRTHLQA